jgi:hypothetical protein
MSFAVSQTVTLNSFQGPSMLFRSTLVVRWMLKQVQHDDVDNGL